MHGHMNVKYTVEHPTRHYCQYTGFSVLILLHQLNLQYLIIYLNVKGALRHVSAPVQ